MTPRQTRIILSARQQGALIAQLTPVVSAELGIGESRARRVVTEVLARLTPDMTLSEMTILKTLDEELGSYGADPAAYEARCEATEYAVPALEPGAPPDLGSVSADLLALHAPAPAPTRAVPVEEWWEYAHQVDGYDVAERLGWELGDLANLMLDHYGRSGEWRGSYLDLRLALFFRARAFRHWGVSIEEAGEEFQREIEDLLAAIAASRVATEA